MERWFDLSIPKPCHENWSNFQQTSQGGFCSQCQKEVIDFTTWTEDQIKAYFIQHTGSTCGRFKKTQLKNYTQQKPRSRSPWQTWPVPVLGLSLLLWTGEAEAQQLRTDTTERVMSLGEVSAKQVNFTSSSVVKGKVLSADDEMPLPGVRVTLKGTTLETLTDTDGMFSLTINNPSPADTIVVSFIGYMTQEVPVFRRDAVTVVLSNEVVGDLEVVVAGGVMARHTWAPRTLWWRIKRLFS
jgi:hypothetical protein